jgi:hypothetical protein
MIFDSSRLYKRLTKGPAEYPLRNIYLLLPLSTPVKCRQTVPLRSTSMPTYGITYIDTCIVRRTPCKLFVNSSEALLYRHLGLQQLLVHHELSVRLAPERGASRRPSRLLAIQRHLAVATSGYLSCILRGCCTLNDSCATPGPRSDRVLIRRLTAGALGAWVKVLRRWGGGRCGVGGGGVRVGGNGGGLSVGVVRYRGE